jgi:dodecin
MSNDLLFWKGFGIFFSSTSFNLIKSIMERMVKIIEVISVSDKDFTDAVKKAVQEASKTVKNIKSVYVKEMKAGVENNQIVTYAVNCKISFEIDR